jgi:hypothetical protein
MKKSQPSDVEKLEAPVQLTPEQLEIVAAGFAKQVVLERDEMRLIRMGIPKSSRF